MKLILVILACIGFTYSYAQPKPVKIPALDSVLPGYQFTVGDTMGHTFTTVIKPAEFRGGLGAWVAYLEKNLNHELGAKYIKLKKSDTMASQSVIVSFIVNANGMVTEVSAEKEGIHPKLAEEAMRVIRDGPRWEPARIDVFENINGEIPVQQILEKSKKGFPRSIFRHLQKITFVNTR